jgi:Replication protein
MPSAHRKRETLQGKLLDDQTLWKEQVLRKLQTPDRINPETGHWHAPTAQLQNFGRCGVDQIFKTCAGCETTTIHAYHCMIKWCPLCNWRITERRRELLKQWLPTIEQPKHLVTTQRNTTALSRQMIREHTANLSRLRRTEVFKQVRGGCVSVEITNESRGWHLHAHWLVDARWVDAKELSVTWGKLVGQDFAIVKVLDARNKTDYQRELMKYVCKGSELARWSPDELQQFVDAVRGQRFFFSFGQLFKVARQLRAQAEADKPPATPCDCGSCQFLFTTEASRRRWKERHSRR